MQFVVQECLSLDRKKNLTRYTPTKLRKKKLSCSTFMMYLGLDHGDITHYIRSGLPTIFEPARISFNLICQRFGLPHPVARPFELVPA